MMSSVSQQAAKENGGAPILYPMLTPHNYTVWAIKTEAILDAQGVWEAIEPAEGTEVEAKKDKTGARVHSSMYPRRRASPNRKEEDREGSVGESQDEIHGQRAGEEGASTNLEERV